MVCSSLKGEIPTCVSQCIFLGNACPSKPWLSRLCFHLLAYVGISDIFPEQLLLVFKMNNVSVADSSFFYAFVLAFGL